MSKESSRQYVVGGILLIFTGVLLLLKNMDWLPFAIPSYFFSWKMIFIGLGIFLLTGKDRFLGLLFIGLGVYFLLPDVLDISRKEIRKLWPILLVFIGIALLMSRKGKGG